MKLLTTLFLTGLLSFSAHSIRSYKNSKDDYRHLLELGANESSVCLIFSELGVFTGVLIDKDYVLTVAQPFANQFPPLKAQHVQKEQIYTSVGRPNVLPGMIVFTEDLEPLEVDLIRRWIDEDNDYRQICQSLSSLHIDAIPFDTITLHYDYDPESKNGNLAMIRLNHPPKMAKPMPLCSEELSLFIQETRGLSDLKAVGYGYGFGDYLKLQRVGAIIDYSPYVIQKNHSWLLHFSPTTPKKFSDHVLDKEGISNLQRGQIIKHTFFPNSNFGRFTAGDQGAPLIYKGKLCALFSHNTVHACPPSMHDPSSFTRFDLLRTSQTVGKSTPLWTRTTKSALTLMRAMLHR